ncbi:hypothetical protein G7Z17_g12921 [Cylindrodendrum hubeiense]|uniref:Uncharacterized protein n=1 Tax=Cylindrodendrum hubeiense TaxID=595255 RepID=A0A9P5L523_9HYPO|nr:hypothetical protein G7Z17_g12921 [Cylindrodendrum hubeiense]
MGTTPQITQHCWQSKRPGRPRRGRPGQAQQAKYPAVACLARARARGGSVEIRRLCSTWNAGTALDRCQVEQPVAGGDRGCDLVSALTEIPGGYLSNSRSPWIAAWLGSERLASGRARTHTDLALGLFRGPSREHVVKHVVELRRRFGCAATRYDAARYDTGSATSDPATSETTSP